MVATRAPLQTKARQDRLGECDSLVKTGDIVARLGTNEKRVRLSRHSETAAAIASSPTCVTSFTSSRQHVCWQAVAVPRKCIDERPAVLGIMKHNDGLLAAGFAVGGQQRAQFAQQRVGRWQGIAWRRQSGRQPRIARNRRRYTGR